MVKVINPGFYTTLQDLGREGHLDWGVPVSGCMDRNSANLANHLVGNHESEAVLECTMVGPELEFTKSTFFVVTGAVFEMELDNQIVKTNEPQRVFPGQRLVFGSLKKGIRAYLAVAGGFQTSKIFGSQSYYFPVTPFNRLTENQTIDYKERTRIRSLKKNISKVSTPLSSGMLYAKQGPEFNLLTFKQQEKLFSETFRVSNRNNRMAYLLEPKLKPLEESIITSPVIPGTVQMTPDGSLFVLMRDGQTTGGYPRVLQLMEESLNALSQLRTGSNFRLAQVAP